MRDLFRTFVGGVLGTLAATFVSWVLWRSEIDIGSWNYILGAGSAYLGMFAVLKTNWLNKA